MDWMTKDTSNTSNFNSVEIGTKKKGASSPLELTISYVQHGYIL